MHSRQAVRKHSTVAALVAGGLSLAHPAQAGTLANGAACTANSDCASNTCGTYTTYSGNTGATKKACMPKAGTAARGDICYATAQCASGQCIPTGSDSNKGKCQGSANGAACTANSDCESNTCGTYTTYSENKGATKKACMPKAGTAARGAICYATAQCVSGQCIPTSSDSPKGKCQPSAIGAVCKADGDCESNTCGTYTTYSENTGATKKACMPKAGTAKPGETCYANNQCANQMCQGIPSNTSPSGKCLLFSPWMSALNKTLNSPTGSTLRGWVDLHSHPMAHLGFGGKVIHGAPGHGLSLLPGSSNESVNRTTPYTTTDIHDSLGSCHCSHGTWAPDNGCGNIIRKQVLDGIESGNNAARTHAAGWNVYGAGPAGHEFDTWPSQGDILHQVMWEDWVKRAYQGGQRVLVALAINSVTLAKGVQADGQYDDKTSADLQIDQTKVWINNNAFMRLVKTPADLKSAVQQDKLAVVLGVELDDLGSFYYNRASRNNQPPSKAAVRAEIQRLHDKGVRYFFINHLIDNYFAGTAIYNNGVARANKYQTGSWWNLGCAGPGDKITHQVTSGWDLVVSAVLGDAGGTQPVPSCSTTGHVNKLGLTSVGRDMLDKIMELGDLIDIDHSSQLALHGADGIIEHTQARSYPLISGHNGLRTGSAPSNSENSRTAAEYQKIAARHGMAGIGVAGANARAWPAVANSVLAAGGNNLYIALGTDANGMSKLPEAPPSICNGMNSCGVMSPQSIVATGFRCNGQRCVKYDAAFPQPSTLSRKWDYNFGGVSHYGMIPDFLRDVEVNSQETRQAPNFMTTGEVVVDRLFRGAEGFLKTWEAAAAASKK
jgi:microsomal dipeptidase-like Zn-dependent dipeptidase